MLVFSSREDQTLLGANVVEIIPVNKFWLGVTVISLSALAITELVYSQVSLNFPITSFNFNL
jgi:hypothetical protein